ncbi:MAG TPA: bifunctional diaminohydroxyphosphoribosylaminopyrimidine deaminase/5-amino-6-(5-phosphoribosylamino)uracil reductase RibD [Blastocatellia bacterium]|nr:bifunctional diaminohydroxyphosphoribosylaminopyrimidine deaminase/5-amino-6-(5-phosphoribosylamino)uracil reductase RibD [Blastocatellia bacterium]
MFDADKIFMRRALELARRGAGLTSPNPMVGAVLVNESRVVGEGYHRYDSVKHAETHALEAARESARGATLYVNLEPCCHQGRTPPCTDALINAGIARAVVAIKDPNKRVAGRGIEQLREAGIEVDVGLLEDEALRLNESYIKFVGTGLPFVHGVIEYSANSLARNSDWRPSNEFLRLVSEYDALILGGRAELNRLVADAAVGRERHRQLVVAVSNEEHELLRSLRKRIASKSSTVRFDARPAAEAAGNVVSLIGGAPRGVERSQLRSLLTTLGRMNVTSVVVLPGSLDLGDSSNFEELDKATLVIPGNEQRFAAPWVYGDIEFDLDDVSVTAAHGCSELTGYPSLRGVA